MRELNVLEDLVSRLENERSYPPESFALQIGFPDGRFVDLAVFNDRTGTLLAAFETKHEQATPARTTVALRQSLESLSKDARGALLFGIVLRAAGGTQLYRYSGSQELEPIDFTDIPSYTALSGAVVVRKSAEVEKSKRSVRQTIERKSYFFASSAALLSMAGILGWWTPTWELLALLGVTCVLFLLPELSHFKLLGLEMSLLSSEIDSASSKSGDSK